VFEVPHFCKNTVALAIWSTVLCVPDAFLRATAVPGGTAEARISYGDSVRPSVRHGPVANLGEI